MGASRKLQGEIDRVLKKVQEGVDVFESIWNKVYDTENVNQKEKFEADLKKEIKKLQRYRDQIKTWLQSSEIKDKRALMDARKQIEREMERFKICEKETKTKAFSKEGLVQQPKTDPKEKAKSETREWINTVVADLESQIENFEAEVENLSAKKGKAKTTRLEHLETSITRHKAHIMKLELLLRLLDNEELSPEQVNDVKDFLYDYVERNQDDFDDFSDVDELYSTLPMDKVESLEDLVAVGTTALIKGVSSLSGSTSPLSLKNSVTSSSNQLAAVSPSMSQDQSEETSSLESNSDVVSRTTHKDVTGSVVSSIPHGIGSGTGSGPNAAAASGNTSSVSLANVSTATAVLPNPGSTRVLSENITVSAAPGVNPSLVKEDDNLSLLSRRQSPAPIEINIGRGVGKGSLVGVVSNPPLSTSSMTLGSIGSFHGAVTLGTVPSVSDAAKRNVQGADEKSGTGNLAQPLLSPLTNKLLLQQASRPTDNHGLLDINNAGESPVTGGRLFSPSAIGAMQWRSPSVNSFQNQSDAPQSRVRTEIAPDQREKFLQRFQQVQQQGASSHLNISQLPGIGQNPFYSQQQSSFLQQLSSQSSVSSQVGPAAQPLGISGVSSPQQQSLVHQQLSQQNAVLRDFGQVKIEDQLIPSDGLNSEPSIGSGPNNCFGEDDLKSPFRVSSTASISESFQQPKDVDLSLGQPTPSSQSATTPGVIGRRATSDLGAIGDNINGSVGFSVGIPDQNFNLQMLESAYYKLPQPRDSERVKTYVPRHPVATPLSYPQAPSALFDNPAFWERLSLENGGADTLFFAFYHQQKTYQQYLAARELKRQSWRYHKKYNTWFQRHEEPKITTDDYEQGTYVYFDFHIADDGSQNGWCQRIKTEFRFEYNFLEDELPV